MTQTTPLADWFTMYMGLTASGIPGTEAERLATSALAETVDGATADPIEFLLEVLLAPMLGPLPAVCPYCDLPKATIEWRRSNTAYAEDIMNWHTMCADCFEIDEEYWRGQWEDYYSRGW